MSGKKLGIWIYFRYTFDVYLINLCTDSSEKHRRAFLLHLLLTARKKNSVGDATAHDAVVIVVVVFVDVLLVVVVEDHLFPSAFLFCMVLA